MAGKKLSNEERSILEARAGYRCEYCRSPMFLSTQPFEKDHILPDSKGGETVLENLALACSGCNKHKFKRTHAKDEVSNKMVRLFNPRMDDWNEHFIWSPDLLRIEALTPIGRATEKALKLNRKELVVLRHWLVKLKVHPPEN